MKHLHDVLLTREFLCSNATDPVYIWHEMDFGLIVDGQGVLARLQRHADRLRYAGITVGVALTVTPGEMYALRALPGVYMFAEGARIPRVLGFPVAVVADDV